MNELRFIFLLIIFLKICSCQNKSVNTSLDKVVFDKKGVLIKSVDQESSDITISRYYSQTGKLLVVETVKKGEITVVCPDAEYADRKMRISAGHEIVEHYFQHARSKNGEYLYELFHRMAKKADILKRDVFYNEMDSICKVDLGLTLTLVERANAYEYLYNKPLDM